jgi:hypothetical protein
MYDVLSTKYKVEIRSTHRGGQARYDIQANCECPTPNVELRRKNIQLPESPTWYKIVQSTMY